MRRARRVIVSVRDWGLLNGERLRFVAVEGGRIGC
jgi:hypothetical protein